MKAKGSPTKAALWKRLLCLAVAGLCLYAAKGQLPSLIAITADATILSAVIAMPEGGRGLLTAVLSPARLAATDVAAIDEELDDTLDDSKNSSSSLSATASYAVSSSPSVSAPEGYGTILAKTISTKSSNLSWKNVHISNKTASHTINIEQVLKAKPNITFSKGKPTVLIVHTHTTEAYSSGTNGLYNKSESTRSTDLSKTVCRVGEEIRVQLEAAGIGVLHDKTLHDYPSYSGSYNAAASTIRSYLKKHPTICVVLDIHRDALSQGDNVKVKLAKEIDGKQAAQVMIISGCQEGNVVNFDHWAMNLRLSLRLQNALETDYPGLARPLMFTARRYNMHLTHGSMLIEMGTDGNTLEEAIYSGQLLGKSLSKVLSTVE